jgi:hypothetical protein
MHAFGLSLIPLLSIVDLAPSQTTDPLPRFRPALIGNGPTALVNVINTKRLMEKGQRDGLVMFKCDVFRSGSAGGYGPYPETPGSKVLEEETGLAMLKSRFIPAIYNGERTDVTFSGTVVFLVRDGKPHLHIYANQSRDDIKKGNDFIAPQLVPNTVDWAGSEYDLAAQKARVYHQKGAIGLSITVDANGNQKDLKVIVEAPPGFGLGTVARNAFAKAKWIPGFRNGHAVECTFDYTGFFGL